MSFREQKTQICASPSAGTGCQTLCAPCYSSLRLPTQNINNAILITDGPICTAPCCSSFALLTHPSLLMYSSHTSLWTSAFLWQAAVPSHRGLQSVAPATCCSPMALKHKFPGHHISSFCRTSLILQSPLPVTPVLPAQPLSCLHLWGMPMQ